MKTPVSRHRTTVASAVAIAALSVAIQADAGAVPTEFRLLPYGRFKAADGSGRPVEVPDGWFLDRETAALIAENFNARQDARVIDYEHQTLNAEKNGLPAPAAGWIGKLEARDDGLYATGVEWTAAAAQMIANREYRYVSPVFPYSKKTGAVLAVAHAALVNYAGLDGLTDLAGAAALSALFQEDPPMNEELLEQLRWLLNLPVGTSAEEIVAHLQKVIDQIKAGGAVAAASGTFDLAKYLADRDAEVAALKAAEPDPARFVSIAVLTSTQTELQKTSGELAALRATVSAAELEDVIKGGIAGGKLLPAQEASMREWGKRDLAALKSFVASAPVVGPVAMQAGAKGGGDKSHQHSDADTAVMKAMGLTAEQFAAGKQEE